MGFDSSTEPGGGAYGQTILGYPRLYISSEIRHLVLSMMWRVIFNDNYSSTVVLGHYQNTGFVILARVLRIEMIYAKLLKLRGSVLVYTKQKGILSDASV